MTSWRSRRGFGVMLTVVLFTTAAAQAQTQRTLAPEDVLRFKAVSDPQLSPDGKVVAYVVTTTNREKNKRESAIWIVAADGSGEPKPLIGDIPARLPRWSPDGKWLGFISTAAAPEKNSAEEGQPKAPPQPAVSPKAQVWMVAADGSGRRRLTHAANGITRFSWSPDSSLIAFVAKEGDSPMKSDDIRHYSSMAYKSDESGWFDPANRNHISIIDVRDGNTRQLTSGSETDDSDPQWSPDGKSIAYVAEESGPALREVGNILDVLIVPAAGGAPKMICERHAYVSSPRWSPDGSRLAYAAAPTPDEQAVLWIADIRSGAAPQLASTADLFPTEVEWDRKGLWFGAGDRGSQVVYRINPDTRNAKKVIGGDRTVHNVSFSDNSDEVAYAADDNTHPDEVYIADLDGSHERQLTFHNRDLLSHLELSPTQRISWKSVDGLEIEGFLTRPADWHSDQKYPMILMVHGGPNGMFGFHWNLEEQLYAGSGYAVFRSNPRGSSGYGMKFQRAVAGQWGGKAYQDIMNGVESITKNDSWIDGNHLGVVGVSYGGFMTNWIVSQTTRFKAAVSISGISNFISVEGTRDGAFGHSRDFGGDVFSSFDNYWKYSPLHYAAQVKTPILFLHGDADNRVPLSQAEEYFRAIKHFGGTADLVVFPHENHTLVAAAEPKHLVEAYRWRLYWFDRYVKGDLKAMAPDANSGAAGNATQAGE
jgi:dipeptidyl aminopeptidase/acylaminoacyl peptidase